MIYLWVAEGQIPELFFLDNPVKMQANVPDHVLAVEHFLAGAAG